jgi:nucleoside-diphosphate-sugar epimerase
MRDWPIDESTAPDPVNSYAASKFAAEQMLSDILPSNTRLIVASVQHSGAGQDERFVLPSLRHRSRGSKPDIPRAHDGRTRSARLFALQTS